MSRDDIEIEEGREVVRRTIVGGRPLARRKRTLRVPIGVEKLIVRAAGDDDFRRRLFTDRATALQDPTLGLSPSEATILSSVPDATLAQLVERVDLKRHGRSKFMQGVVAAAFAAAATTTLIACEESSTSKGIRPDDVQESLLDVDAEDTMASRGAVPDLLEVEDVPPQAGVPIDVPQIYVDAGIQDANPYLEVEDVPPQAGVQVDVEVIQVDAGVTVDVEDVPPQAGVDIGQPD